MGSTTRCFRKPPMTKIAGCNKRSFRGHVARRSRTTRTWGTDSSTGPTNSLSPGITPPPQTTRFTCTTTPPLFGNDKARPVKMALPSRNTDDSGTLLRIPSTLHFTAGDAPQHTTHNTKRKTLADPEHDTIANSHCSDQRLGSYSKWESPASDTDWRQTAPEEQRHAGRLRGGRGEEKRGRRQAGKCVGWGDRRGAEGHSRCGRRGNAQHSPFLRFKPRGTYILYGESLESLHWILYYWDGVAFPISFFSYLIAIPDFKDALYIR